jgi:hypothetical protein
MRKLIVLTLMSVDGEVGPPEKLVPHWNDLQQRHRSNLLRGGVSARADQRVSRRRDRETLRSRSLSVR